MIATLATAAIGGTVAALMIISLVFWLERDYQKIRRATVNVYGSAHRALAPHTTADPENNAQETPHAHAGTHTPHTPAAPHTATARQGNAPYRVAATGTILAPAATDPDDLSNLDDAALIEKGRAAISRWKSVASQYKSLAETLEASLYAARQDAEQQRDRADKLQALYVRRTQQALHAGFRIVIDHGDQRSE